MTDKAALDEQLYQGSISLESLKSIYQLFTMAIDQGNMDDAKMLMNQLTEIAPEDPRAIRARTTYRTNLSKNEKK